LHENKIPWEQNALDNWKSLSANVWDRQATKNRSKKYIRDV
jgi:hypothetical protein